MAYSQNKVIVCALWCKEVSRCLGNLYSLLECLGLSAASISDTASCQCTWERADHGPNTREVQMGPWLLALTWPSSICCWLLVCEPVDGKASLQPPLCFPLCYQRTGKYARAFQINKTWEKTTQNNPIPHSDPYLMSLLSQVSISLIVYLHK